VSPPDESITARLGASRGVRSLPGIFDPLELYWISMSHTQRGAQENVEVFIDPSCPWAWRGARWMIEVSSLTQVTVTWRGFSLKLINEGRNHPRAPIHLLGLTALRTLCLIRRSEGNDGFDRLYRAIGEEVHRHGLELTAAGLERSVARAGLGASVLDAALGDPTTLDEVRNEHDRAVRQVGGFGVPTLIRANGRGIFGPVLSSVPAGDSALSLWLNVSDMIDRDEFFELKRRRP
jgi:2-hydroxychromene-2-carboxylate isomerase